MDPTILMVICVLKQPFSPILYHSMWHLLLTLYSYDFLSLYNDMYIYIYTANKVNPFLSIAKLTEFVFWYRDHLQ